MRHWSILQWVAAIIVIAGIIAILFIAVHALGFMIPPWLIDMAIVVAVVTVALIALGLVATVWSSWFGPPPPTP